jgi:hypothetical protein
MTDRLAALELLAGEDSPARVETLQHFHEAYHDQPLAMLKWLYIQVRELAAHQLSEIWADARDAARLCC